MLITYLIIALVCIAAGVVILLLANRIFPSRIDMPELQRQQMGFDKNHALRAVGAMFVAIGIFILLMVLFQLCLTPAA